MVHLQVLFARLQGLNAKAILPDGFVRSLQLDPRVQQDAQEFYKLLINYLEHRFAKNERAEIQKLIKNELVGFSADVTRCDCGRQIRQKNEFYELNLPIVGLGNISECLSRYLHPERLEGFRCEDCNQVNSSTRKVELTSLPPILNLTLMRFIFDMQLGDKKKLTHDISFGNELVMTHYVVETDEPEENRRQNVVTREYVYELRAVVCHLGPTAHGGHYVSYVLQKERGIWWKFDDSEVSFVQMPPWQSSKFSLQPSYQRLVSQFDYPSYSSFHTYDEPLEKFETPYMLFYRLRDYPDTTPEVPAHLLEAVAAENERLRATVAAWEEQRPVVLLSLAEERRNFEHLLTQIALPPEATEYFWISTEWLKRWMRDASDIPPIDNTGLLCIHSKVNFRKVNEMKRIAPVVWRHLFDTYGGGPTLSHEDNCVECVTDHVIRERTSRQSKATQNRIISELNYYSVTVTVVSRAWIRRFRDAAIFPPASGEIPDICFDIVCPHGNLTPKTELHDRIPQRAYQMIISSYFPERPESMPTFPGGTELCPLCRRAAEEEREARSRRLAELREERKPFDRVYYGNRKESRLLRPGMGNYMAVSSRWLRAWRTYLDQVGPPPGPVNSSDLFCEPHGLWCCDLIKELDAPIEQARFELVEEADYFGLVDKYTCLGPVPLVQFTAATQVSRSYSIYGGSQTYTYTFAIPNGTCKPCLEVLERKLMEERLDFGEEMVTIKDVYHLSRQETLSSQTPIEAIRIRIHDLWHVPPSEQLLLYKDQILTDGVLRDYNFLPPGPITVERVSPQTLGGAGFSRPAEQPRRPRDQPEEGIDDSALRTLLSSSAASPSALESPVEISEPPQPINIPSLANQPAVRQPIQAQPPPPSPAAVVAAVPAPQPPLTAALVDSPASPGGWNCGACTFQNAAELPSCEICETPRFP